jgi:type II secretory pathway pseudopilin PulG
MSTLRFHRARPARVPTLDRRAARRAGLGLVECMISLAIASALLTAVAAAFSATTDAMEENDTFFQATHTGRIALHRILTQVRRGMVDENSTASNLRLITDSGLDVTYRYDTSDPSNKVLKFITNNTTTDPDYILAQHLETCQFSTEIGPDHQGNSCVLRVSLVLTVRVGNNTILLTGTAAPRRNFAF